MQQKHNNYYGGSSRSYGSSYGSGYGYGGWGNSRYSGSSWFKEVYDFYIREHEYYYTPSEYLVENRLYRANLNHSQTAIAREMARFYYFRMINQPHFHERKYIPSNISKLSEEEQKRASKKEEFYTALWDKKVPGVTPLDKAINSLIIMKKAAKKQGLSDKFDPTDLDMEKVFDGVPDEEKFESVELKKLLSERKIDDFENKVDMLQKIAAVEAFGKSFEIKKTVHEKRVTNSIMHKQKRMIEYGELINIPLYQRLMPNFSTKMITKDLIVNTPVESTESKQKIIMLLDFSGSMRSTYKQDWVLAILADRLSYCVKEECEIFFSLFLTHDDLVNRRFQWHHIYNEKTALNFFREFSTQPNGGDTEVGLIVEEIRKEIMENHKLFNLNIDLSKEMPEILVINDGQDSVKTDKLTWKTNAITLYDGANSELKSLTDKTGGKYVFIDHTFDK